MRVLFLLFVVVASGCVSLPRDRGVPQVQSFVSERSRVAGGFHWSAGNFVGAFELLAAKREELQAYRLYMVNGLKEFHLIAEEIEHEFAPGQKIKAWGYNGSTPGPTIEAVEGERIRILVTNRLPEHTSIHWHGILLPNGMDGVGGLTQPQIAPGETYAYEFRLRQFGTHMYHPHADEVVQLSSGMMGLFVIHPRSVSTARVDRDFALLLHNWAVHPGTYRPDPTVMTDFDLWTFNSKVFPAIDPLVVRTGQRVRIRVGNLSMHEHPIHMHGFQFWVTGGDGGRWQRSAWRREVTELVGVGQTRDIELLPGYMTMGEKGMSEHQDHVEHGHMPGPENTLPSKWAACLR